AWCLAESASCGLELLRTAINTTILLRLAALNQPYTGDMRGVTGVDYTCYREARRAGLSGTFRAFLTSRIQNLDSIVRRDDANLPVVNIKGEVLFNTWRGIFSGDGGRFMQKPRIFSFDGKEVLTSPEWPQKYIWHGSDIEGGRALSSFCDAWHSDSRDVVGLASSLQQNHLLSQEKHGCHNSFIVLCIEATSHAYKSSGGRRRRHAGKAEQDMSEEEYFEVLSALEDV
ncbi:collagen alpha-1(XVIII) chain-like, partial [Portunus trituberculatus]|uniref:collagen alpha-1(XVIII) chain-like n=1 Tax=Portunus trituberculatus TaxID=210409 RepID=UPI001E1CCBDD